MSAKTFPLMRLFMAALAVTMFIPSKAPAYEREPQRPAIVLAAFGTTDLEGLKAIVNVEKKVQAAFPGHDVHLAFTSNIIRSIWHKRAADAKFRRDNPQAPGEMYDIVNPLTRLALIQEGGSRDILVQSLHITNGTEFDDLKKIIGRLAGIEAFQESKRPFPYLALGDSALGRASQAELDRAARALAPLAAEAESSRSILLLMGHGNAHLDVKAYRQLEKAMNEMYAAPVVIALVEGEPELPAAMAALAKTGLKKVLAAPLMLVAGDHAKNDMAGPEEDSWASTLRRAGYEVECRVEGLGLSDAWAGIYIERLRELEGGRLKKAGK